MPVVTRDDSGPADWPSFDISNLTWCAIGNDGSTDADPRTRLIATIKLGGVNFHLDAYEVHGGEGIEGEPECQETINEEHASWFAEWANAAGGDGAFETVEIESRDYVIFASPFTQ